MGQSTATDDFDRLMAGELIQRPTPRERAAGEWDWWRQLSPADRRWFGRNYMAEVGDRPEDVARRNGHGTDCDAAMAEVLAAARLQKRARARKTATAVADQVADWEAADRAATVRDVLAELYGPQELATILSTTTQNVHQMAHRGRLPMADLIVSKVPLWHADTLRAAGIMREQA